MTHEVRNPRYTEAGIYCELNYPEHGWIPFHATANDVEPLGREIYEQLEQGQHGPIEAYAPPPAEHLLQRERESMEVSPAQFRMALRRAGLRQAVDDYVASADDDIKDSWEYASFVRRLDARVITAADALSVDAESLDDLFRLAATL